MISDRRRFGFLMVAGAIAVVLATLVALVWIGSSEDPPTPAELIRTATVMRAGPPDLFDATVHTESPQAVNVGTTFKVSALLCGPKSNPPKQCASPLSIAGIVKGGALVRTWITTDPRLQIVTDANPTQAVNFESDLATWIWLVKATEPGRYEIFLHSVATDADGQPLVPETLIALPVTVESTAFYVLSAVRGAVKAFVTDLSTILGALGLSVSAAAIFLWKRYRRRQQRLAAASLTRVGGTANLKPADTSDASRTEDKTVTGSSNDTDG